MCRDQNMAMRRAPSEGPVASERGILKKMTWRTDCFVFSVRSSEDNVQATPILYVWVDTDLLLWSIPVSGFQCLLGDSDPHLPIWMPLSLF